MSRFMLQLLVESKLSIKQWALQAGQEPMKLPTPVICKDEAVLKKAQSHRIFLANSHQYLQKLRTKVLL